MIGCSVHHGLWASACRRVSGTWPTSKSLFFRESHGSASGGGPHGRGSSPHRCRSRDSRLLWYSCGISESGTGSPVEILRALVMPTKGRGPGPVWIHSASGASISPHGWATVTITSEYSSGVSIGYLLERILDSAHEEVPQAITKPRTPLRTEKEYYLPLGRSSGLPGPGTHLGPGACAAPGTPGLPVAIVRSQGSVLAAAAAGLSVTLTNGLFDTHPACELPPGWRYPPASGAEPGPPPA